MDQAVIIIGVLGGIISIVDFFISNWVSTNRFVHVTYIFILILLVSFVTFQGTKIARLNDVARHADQLIADRKMEYTSRGFVFAALAFLEKNRDLFPDSYDRANTMCLKFKCDEPGSDPEMTDLSYAMNGIVQGLGTMSE